MPFLIAYLVIGIIFAIIGSRMARARQRDPALWAVICFLFPLIGVLALALAGGGSSSSVSGAISADVQRKWAALIELDPDIRAAAERVREYGAKYELLLAQKFMAIGDKGYLKAAEEAVVQEASLDKARAEEMYQSFAAQGEAKPFPYPVALKVGIASIALATVAACATVISIWLCAAIAYSAFLGMRWNKPEHLFQIGLAAAVSGLLGSYWVHFVDQLLYNSPYTSYGLFERGLWYFAILGIGCPIAAFAAGRLRA